MHSHGHQYQAGTFSPDLSPGLLWKTGDRGGPALGSGEEEDRGDRSLALVREQRIPGLTGGHPGVFEVPSGRGQGSHAHVALALVGAAGTHTRTGPAGRPG